MLCKVRNKNLLKFIALTIIIFTMLPSFIACDNVDPKNYETPELNSLITYTLNDDEYIVLMYYETKTNANISKFIGEWHKGSEVKRIEATPYTQYWGLGTARYGVDDYYYEITEVDKLEIYGDTNIDNAFVGSPFKTFKNYEPIGYMNAGVLNSTYITLNESQKTVSIQSIDVSPSDFEEWDWMIDLDGWADFCSYDENTEFKIDALNLSYTPYRNIGKWVTPNGTLDIKIVFYDDIKAFALYDISNVEGKLMFLGNVELDDEQNATFTSFYGEIFNEDINIDNVNTLTLHKESN